MQKHKKILKRALLVIVLVFVAFFGFREIMSFVPDSDSVDTDSYDVQRRETQTLKTTDGATCGSSEEMNGHYGPKVSFDVSSRTATITVKNGSFKVTSVSDQSILVDDPTTLGVVSRNNPMVIRYGNFSGDVVLHFVLAETDDKCLSYDELYS